MQFKAQRNTDLMPGLVAVFQPCYGSYRVFLTGGQRDATKWIFGKWDGFSTLTKETVQKNGKLISKGVYAL